MARRQSPVDRTLSATRNALLGALPPIECRPLLAKLTVTPLCRNDVLHEPGQPVDRVYFPTEGFCSLVNVLHGGRMVEVATVGREGMLGLAACVEGSSSPALTVVQGDSNSCYSLAAHSFREELDRHGAFHALIARYTHAFAASVMQSTACNAAHSVERRFARWLLHAQDRLERDAFVLTQDIVATMLGVSRPMVSNVAGKLQKAGLITYMRGHIEIRDRQALELVACECYQAAKLLLMSVSDGSRGELGKPSPSAGPPPGTRSTTRTQYRCLACGGKLVLVDRDTTTTRFHARVTTEAYCCDACAAEYVLTPSTGWWKSMTTRD